MATMEELVVKLAQYRDKLQAYQPVIDELDALKAQVKELALELGEGVEIEGASVGIRSGYVRVGYDWRKLDGYAVAHPEVLTFRSESEVGPSAVVKVEL